MKQLILTLAVCSIAVLRTSAATGTSWTDAGADNRWSNPANWSNGVPVGESGSVATIPAGDWTIVIDEAKEYYALDVADGSGTVSLTGSGSLAFASTGASDRKLSIGAGRELIVDGPEITEWSYEQLGNVTIKSGIMHAAGKGMSLEGGCKIVVEGGAFEKYVSKAVTVTVANGAEIVVKDGRAVFDALELQDGGALRVLGGTVRLPDGFSVPPAATFSWQGGMLERAGALNTLALIQEYFPRKNAALNLLATGDSAVGIKADDAIQYDLSGMLVVTNNGAITISMSKTYTSLDIAGRGDLIVNKLAHYANKSNAEIAFDVASLTLGTGGIVATDPSHNDSLLFMNGITFGAFGDWSSTDSSAEKPTKIVLSGPVVFDTLDAFDGATKRMITLSRVDLSDMASLAVRGGGRVNLAAMTPPQYLQELSLTDATTLALQGANVGMRAGSITLDEGSLLLITPDTGCFIDAVSAANLAAGSVKLTFADAGFSTARQSVYFAPVGADPDLAAFDTVDLPAGLSLAKREHVVYLTDGSADANDISAATKDNVYWKGDVDGSWQDAGNWTSAKAVGTGDFGNMHFKGWKNMVMLNTQNQARPRSMTVDAGCGPVWVRGGPSTHIRFNQENAIYSYSDNPLVVETEVGMVNGYSFAINNSGSSYVALTGGAHTGDKNANTNVLKIAGDVRLGGFWQFRALGDLGSEMALTLLPGADFSLIGQDEVLQESLSVRVAAGASFTVGEGSSIFGMARVGTHFVDGTWMVACPFEATSLQTFRGAGTLKLASLSTSAEGIEIADSMTLVPGNWNKTAKVFFRDTPTVKTQTATTIGEAVTLELEPHATVAFDTTDGDLTLETPIVGDGNVVKKGEGKLVVDTANCVIDTLMIVVGEVTPGPALVAAADAAYAPFLTVRKLVGELSVKNAKIRVIANADGTTTYSFKNKKGLVLVVR